MRLNEQMAQMVQQQQAAEGAIANAMAAKAEAERKLLEAVAAQTAAAEAAAAAPEKLRGGKMSTVVAQQTINSVKSRV